MAILVKIKVKMFQMSFNNESNQLDEDEDNNDAFNENVSDDVSSVPYKFVPTGAHNKVMTLKVVNLSFQEKAVGLVSW